MASDSSALDVLFDAAQRSAGERSGCRLLCLDEALLLGDGASMLVERQY